MRAKKRFLNVFLICLLFFFSSFCMAQEQEQEDPIEIEADRMEHDEALQRLVAVGHVRITQGKTLELYADRALYYHQKERIEASGNVRLFRDGDAFQGERLTLNLRDHRGKLEPVKADMAGPGGRSSGKVAVRHDRDRFTVLDGTLTHCDCDPPPWYLTSNRVKVDLEINQITATHVVLYLHNIPVAYTPWWRQPARKVRQSGVLTPSFRFTGSNGMEWELPYYWNIAPERDATVAYHHTEERGVLGKLEYRYMGEEYKGSLNMHAINDALDDRHRGIFLMKHRQKLDDWYLDLRLNRLQTRDFMNDFGVFRGGTSQPLISASSRRLTSSIALNRVWAHDPDGSTAFEVGTQWHQDLTISSENSYIFSDTEADRRTVQLLPYLNLEDNRPVPMLSDAWRLNSGFRLDHFYQASGDATQRINLATQLTHRLPLYVGQLTTMLGARETAYNIDGEPTQAGPGKNFRHREASLFNMRLDTPLRKIIRPETPLLGYEAFKHTLEPSVKYQIQASTDQSTIPNYDASLTALSAGSLFSNSLYAGLDRVSREQWVGYGITSRFLGKTITQYDWRWHDDDEAREADKTDEGVDEKVAQTTGGRVRTLATLSLGQRWAPPEHRESQNNRPFSDVVGSIALTPVDALSLSATTRYDPYTHQLQETNAVFDVTSPRRDSLKIGYHYRRPDNEEVSLQTGITLSDEWRLEYKMDYSLGNDVTRSMTKSWETGLLYQHDCWSISFSGGRKLSESTESHDGKWVGFLISFRGLGEYGKKLDTIPTTFGF